MPANPIDLHHETLGEEGPWMTLIHGGLAASPGWDRQVRDLSPNLADVARVLTLDLRGYGRSPQPADGDFSVAAMAEDVAALWHQLGVESSIVVGFSMGGFIAEELALRHPESVFALVLTSTAGGLSAAAADAFAARADEIDRNGLARELDTHVIKAFSPAFREEQPELLEGYTDHIASNAPEAIAASLRAIGEFDRREDLQQLRCPTLVVCGELDENLGPVTAGPLAEAIPGAELVTIPGAGHTVQVENPNAFNSVVTDFLDRRGLA